jgi:6-pyruvoyltetrahydropterin/6-carboxytetrahydropterin synthase
MITVTRKFEVCIAHWLKDHPGKCKDLHGHNFQVEVTVTGNLNKNGMIVDFSELKGIVQNVLDEIDHKCLNTRFPMMNDQPTAEKVVDWLACALIQKLLPLNISLVLVRLYETSNCFVTWVREYWGKSE